MTLFLLWTRQGERMLPSGYYLLSIVAMDQSRLGTGDLEFVH